MRVGAAVTLETELGRSVQRPGLVHIQFHWPLPRSQQLCTRVGRRRAQEYCAAAALGAALIRGQRWRGRATASAAVQPAHRVAHAERSSCPSPDTAPRPPATSFHPLTLLSEGGDPAETGDTNTEREGVEFNGDVCSVKACGREGRDYPRVSMVTMWCYPADLPREAVARQGSPGDAPFSPKRKSWYVSGRSSSLSEAGGVDRGAGCSGVQCGVQRIQGTEARGGWGRRRGVTHELGLSAAGVDLGPAALLNGLAVEGRAGGVEAGAGEHCGRSGGRWRARRKVQGETGMLEVCAYKRRRAGQLGCSGKWAMGAWRRRWTLDAGRLEALGGWHMIA